MKHKHVHQHKSYIQASFKILYTQVKKTANYINMQMLRRRESRASTGRPVTHAAINTSKVKSQATDLSAMVTWKIFALYMSRNSMSINHHRSNLIKHQNTMNNKVTISYHHMHMPLCSFLFVVTKQTMYRPGIHIYHYVVVWPAPYENLTRRSPVYDPKVSCE